MRHAISVWQSRHLNVGCPVDSSWQVVQSVKPSIDLWARESGPGEIWAAAGIKVHKIVNTIHPRSLVFGRAQMLSITRRFGTVVFASAQVLIAGSRNRSAPGSTKSRSTARAALPTPEHPFITAVPMRSKSTTASLPLPGPHHPLQYPATHKEPASVGTTCRPAGQWWR